MAEKKETQRVISNVWLVTREYDGLAGAGGVKDVSRQLSEILVHRGHCQVRVVLPLYGFMDPAVLGFEPVRFSEIRPGYAQGPVEIDMDYPDEERREQVSYWSRTINGVVVYLVEAERFLEKSGVYTYTDQEAKSSSWKMAGMGHYDYFAMNILLQKAALSLMILLNERPDVIHCQDGHAATLPAMVREMEGFRHYFRASGLVVTIHNAGIGYHQEVEDLQFARAITGLPARVISSSLLNKSFDPFLSAAGHALMNAVSDNYARELRETSEDHRTGWLGHQLQNRGVWLEGITNGIDPEEFNPKYPEKLGLPAPFDPGGGDLAGKAICKQALLQSLSGHDPVGHVVKHGSLSGERQQALLTFIGRLTHQKGVDILVQCLGPLLARDRDFQILVLGSGNREFEEQLIALASDPAVVGRVCFLRGYDPDLANRIYAAGDFFLIPSQYEPCGLTDYIAQLLGNIPIVHHVGGLVKVVDRATGFAYHKHEPGALAAVVEDALRLYRYSPETILSMQQAAVRRIHKRHAWEQVMVEYLQLYSRSIEMICHDRQERPV